ncbi:MAG: hypothetical protein WAK20_20470 [Candidatus Acidiferrum sp.]
MSAKLLLAGQSSKVAKVNRNAWQDANAGGETSGIMRDTQIGKYGFSRWTLHMASIMIFSTL